MKKFILVGFVLFCTLLSFSQSKKFKISGTIVSEETNMPLQSATVFLKRAIDSSLITYTISDRNGKFLLENKTSDKKANFFVSYIGYQTYSKAVDLSEATVDIGTIKMLASANSLDEIVITSSSPVVIKKDTLEFNVKWFKTKKDSNVEDLLKELPGVEINAEGSITVNGKPVNRILVNGKPFFGNDPTITTRNLTKDIIEKVQILDTKTKAEAFIGKTVDGETKTVNLVIKKENSRSYFGRLAAGAGTDRHYEYAGILNSFNDDQRISVLGGGNDVNSPGFSFRDLGQLFGGVAGRVFNNQGITESQNYGINYTDGFGKNAELDGNYFYSETETENQNKRDRENFLTDSRYFTSSNSSSFSETDNQDAELEFDLKIGSTLLMNINPSFSSTKSKVINVEDETSSDELNTVINQSFSTSNVENINKEFGNNIEITKKFTSNKSNLRFNLRNDISSSERDRFLNSEVNIFGDTPEDILRDQYTDEENKNSYIESHLIYDIPLKGEEFFLEFSLGYLKDKEKIIRSTFDKDETTNEFSLFNTELSTDSEYINQESTPSVELEYKKNDLSIRLKSTYNHRILENKDELRPQLNLKRDFKALELRNRLRYKFSPKASINFEYTLRNTPPQLTQLQSFRDVSNPLNAIVGNPNLEPEKEHEISLAFSNFDFQKRSGIDGRFRVKVLDNTVIRKTVIGENLVRETTFANVDGNYEINGDITVSNKAKLDSLRTVSFNLAINPSLERIINFNNGVKYSGNIASLGSRLEMKFIWRDVLEINPVYQMNFTKNTFDIENFEDEEFISHNLNLITATFLPKGFEWRNNLQYSYNPNVADGFQKSTWFWNSTLAYSVLKDNGLITLKAYDVLNQNTNVRRIATQNYIEDVESKVLQQYFMLGFSWKFNTKKSKTPEEREGRERRRRRGNRNLL